MRIAMVSEHASPLAVVGGVDAGGQNVHVEALSAALVRQGHDVTVYTRRDDPDLPDRVTMDSGVVVEHVAAGPAEPLPKDALLTWMPDFGHQLAQRWAQDRPDVAHAHFWMSGLACLVARRAVEVPVVQTFHALGAVKRRHQGSNDTSPPERLRLEQAIAKDVDRIVATCSDEVFELVRMGADRRRVSIVPCGVDLDLFTDQGPVAERTERFRMVSVGRLVERKGVDTAVRALRALPDAELIVAGGPPADELDSDPEAQRLLRIAREAGVEDRVQLLGRLTREELPPLLRSADVAVCVPWYEPFGIVPLEAMACRTPVVASAVGGLVDTIAEGVTGLLVPPRRPDRLAAALRRLQVDEFNREAMGLAGVDRARSRYGWDRIAAETVSAYEATLPDSAVDGTGDGQLIDLGGTAPAAAGGTTTAPAMSPKVAQRVGR